MLHPRRGTKGKKAGLNFIDFTAKPIEPSYMHWTQERNDDDLESPDLQACASACVLVTVFSQPPSPVCSGKKRRSLVNAYVGRRTVYDFSLESPAAMQKKQNGLRRPFGDCLSCGGGGWTVGRRGKESIGPA